MIYVSGARPCYLYHFLCVVAKLSEPEKVPETPSHVFFSSGYGTSHDLLISLPFSASNDTLLFIAVIMASESK